METTLDPGLVALRRAKRLQLVMLGMLGVAGLMLVTLALPWLTVSVPRGAVQLPTGEMLSIKGGTITRTGIEAGMTTAVFVNAAILALVTVSTWKRWWMVGAGALVVLWREGIHVPLPVARGAVTMVSGGLGFQLINVLYPLGMALILVAVLQTLAVRNAEKAARAEDTPSAALPLVGILSRVVGAAVREVRTQTSPASPANPTAGSEPVAVMTTRSDGSQPTS